MTSTYQSTALIGVFDDRREAERFVRELRGAGFSDAEMGVVAKENHDLAVEGAEAGAITGGVVGALAGLAVAAGLIPGIGPVLVGGFLGSMLASAATGLAAGGLIGALLGLGMSEEEARHYERHVQAGRTLVVVQEDRRLPEAIQILRRCKQAHGAEPPDGA